MSSVGDVWDVAAVDPVRARTCAVLACADGLACFAGHLKKNWQGEFIHFDFGVGDHLDVWAYFVDGAGLSIPKNKVRARNGMQTRKSRRFQTMRHNRNA